MSQRICVKEHHKFNQPTIILRKISAQLKIYIMNKKTYQSTLSSNLWELKSDSLEKKNSTKT